MVLSLAACGADASSDNPDKTAESKPGTSSETTPAPTQEVTPEPTEAPTAAPTEEAKKDNGISKPTGVPGPGGVLKDAFAEHGIKAGTCCTPRMIENDKLRTELLTHFNSVTCENEMKPEQILNQAKSQETGDLVVEFPASALQIMDFAKENGLSMRGHTLVWHSQTPDWIFYEGFDTKNELVDRDTMLARMDSYFSQVFGFLKDNGYADMFYAYDIANECWMEDGSMRQSKWLQVIGEDYLIEAFKCADKYAPENINLYYNDYNEQFKTETLINFVQTLKDDTGRYYIDGIGFQGHLYTSDDLNAYFETVDALSELGIIVEITELDVCLGKYQGFLKNTDENLRVQGQWYYELFNGLFSRLDAGTLNMDAVTFWGYRDSLSWRSDGYPLLFDMFGYEKYAFYGALQLKEYAGY